LPSVRAAVVDLGELAAACRGYPDALLELAIPAFGRALESLAADEVGRDTGGTGRLSRYNRGRGATLAATATRTSHTTITLTPRPIGAWALLTAGSHKREWVEGTVPGRGPRRGSPRLRLASGSVRWYVRHKGIAGKGTWGRVKDRLDDELAPVIDKAIDDAWAQMRGS
jgi:hypothetical protein